MSEINYYIKIGEIIKELRLKKNMTRKQLADGICSVSYIGRIENGERCPTSVILRQITNKLGISPDYLFRAIESPTSLQVEELLKRLYYYVERCDFNNIYELVNRKEKKLQIESIHDLQIMKTIECVSSTILNEDYQSGINELNNILDLTYNSNNTPTDIEFAIMSTQGFLLLLNNQKEEAYNHLNKIQIYINSINHFHSFAIIPRYYVYLITACIDTLNLNEAILYIDFAINYCKKHNVHSILRELYFLKGELYYHLGKENDFEIWLDKSLTLHELIKDCDYEYFDTFIKTRLKNNKKLTKYIG